MPKAIIAFDDELMEYDKNCNVPDSALNGVIFPFQMQQEKCMADMISGFTTEAAVTAMNCLGHKPTFYSAAAFAAMLAISHALEKEAPGNRMNNFQANLDSVDVPWTFFGEIGFHEDGTSKKSMYNEQVFKMPGQNNAVGGDLEYALDFPILPPWENMFVHGIIDSSAFATAQAWVDTVNGCKPGTGVGHGAGGNGANDWWDAASHSVVGCDEGMESTYRRPSAGHLYTPYMRFHMGDKMLKKFGATDNADDAFSDFMDDANDVAIDDSDLLDDTYDGAFAAIADCEKHYWDDCPTVLVAPPGNAATMQFLKQVPEGTKTPILIPDGTDDAIMSDACDGFHCFSMMTTASKFTEASLRRRAQVACSVPFPEPGTYPEASRSDSS
jgi:hypothetical protein